MNVKIVTDSDPNARTGVPQYYRRMAASLSERGVATEWVPLQDWKDGKVPRNASTDVLIVTNQDVLGIPPEFCAIAVQHGSAGERLARAGEEWYKTTAPAQIEAAKRPRTFWVACSDVSAHECFQHMGVQADRIIFGGLDTDAFFPAERQTRKDVAKAVVLHHCVDTCKGIGEIDAVTKELGAEFEVRGLDADPDSVPDAMRAADMFLCLSVSEGCPYVVSEAMATGLVVVTTDVGLYWRPDGPPGVRFPWQERGDPKVVANAVREAWKTRRGLNGREWALWWLNLPLMGRGWAETLRLAAERFGIGS